MQIFTDISQIPINFENCCAAIGNFDGVHLGHQQLFKHVIEKACLLKSKSMAITFHPHPLSVLTNKKVAVLTPQSLKLKFLQRCNLNYTLCIPFSLEFAKLEPTEFIQLLMDKLHFKHLTIGYDYAFGKARKGNYHLLQTIGAQLGFAVDQLEAILLGNSPISSSRIRQSVQNGDMENATKMLGRNYCIFGTVIHGANRGQALLNTPTANIALTNGVIPRLGVYAVWVEYQNKLFQAVANIGKNPTFGENAISLEAHIFDFNQNLYGHEIGIYFVTSLRSEKKFENIDDLKTQLAKDIIDAKNIFSQHTISF